MAEACRAPWLPAPARLLAHQARSSPACGRQGIVVPLVMPGPMTGPPFAPMSSSSCGAGARPATSSSSTIAAHRVDTIRQRSPVAGGPILHLPPYRPDLNPIEQLCAKLKALLARGRRARGTNSERPPAAASLPSAGWPTASTTAALGPHVVTVLWLQGAGRAARPASRSRCATGMALGRRRERGRRIEGGAPRRPVQPRDRAARPAPRNLFAIEIALCRPGAGAPQRPGRQSRTPSRSATPRQRGPAPTLSLHPARPSFRDDAIAAASSHRAGGEPGAAAVSPSG